MPKNPGGRPTKYESWMCEKAVEVLSKGRSIRNVAAKLDISHVTLYDWMSKYPEFSNSIERGLSKSLEYLEEKLLEIIDNPKKKTHPDQFRTLQLALQTRFHEVYGVKQKIDQTIDANVKTESIEEYLKRTSNND